ncbi:MAG: hypothetical protein WA705_16145 [Candidatus Ozemobacteraceae bacterium]
MKHTTQPFFPQCLFSTVLFIAGLFFTFSLCFAPCSQASEGNITFIGEKIRISYQPRIRSALSTEASLGSEIARLNLITNLLDNYLLYLTKLGKIQLQQSIHLEFSPEGGDDAFSQTGRIPVNDLGLNGILEKVNKALIKLPETSRKFLLQDRAMLSTIRDQLLRRSETIEQTMGLTNLSDFLPSLAPEMDFAFIGNAQFVTIRPEETANDMVLLSLGGSGSILLEAGQHEYGNLLPSPDGQLLAFTEGGKPCILPLDKVNKASPTVRPLFSNGSKILLDWCWSPLGKRLAGIVLDRSSGDRNIFIYDSEKKQLNPILDNHPQVQGNYQFAYPYWSPDGNKLLFCSGTELNLVDLSVEKVFPRIFSTPDLISEVLWAPDSRSFALIEVRGLSRSKADFDNKDFSCSTLRRIDISPAGDGVENLQQRHLASDTLKLVSFWSKDRILFLEGPLHPQHIVSPLWDLQGMMQARLTPSPHAISDSNPALDEIGNLDIAMDGCFAFKNMESRFKNFYDAGFGRMNYLYTEKLITTWVLGIVPPENLPKRWETFCLRPHPYPFPERNVMVFADLPKDKVFFALDTLKSYNLRRFDISSDLKMIGFLSNSRGPLTLWCGPITTFSGNLSHPVAFEEAQGESAMADSAPTASETSLPSGSLPAPVLPSAGLPAPSLLSPGLPASSLPAPQLPGSKQPDGALPAPQLSAPTLPSPVLPSPRLSNPNLPAPSLPAPKN